MVNAFITIKAATGDAEELADRLGGFEHVSAANVVAGDFDVIVEAEGAEVYDVIHSVATRIRGLDDIADTKTYICLN